MVVVLILAGALAWAGCSTVSSDTIDDSEIVSALHLKQTGSGYQVGGDPFCRIDELLNDVDEVNSATDKKNSVDFVIAAPDGEVGVLAHPPFAPSCKRDVTEELKKLARQSKNSD
jgi:hypothetical protein